MAQSTVGSANLERASGAKRKRSAPPRWSVKDGIRRAATQHGATLYQLSHESAVMLVFLRHFGCVFCRETVADIAHRRRTLEMRGIRVAFVHMADEKAAADFFAQYDLDDVPRIADPAKRLYYAFGLERGSIRQLFGLKTITRAIKASMIDKHGMGRWVGDIFQMPGVFLVHEGEIVAAFRHETASDRPDYFRFAHCEDGKDD